MVERRQKHLPATAYTTYTIQHFGLIDFCFLVDYVGSENGCTLAQEQEPGTPPADASDIAAIRRQQCRLRSDL